MAKSNTPISFIQASALESLSPKLGRVIQKKNDTFECDCINCHHRASIKLFNNGDGHLSLGISCFSCTADGLTPSTLTRMLYERADKQVLEELGLTKTDKDLKFSIHNVFNLEAVENSTLVGIIDAKITKANSGQIGEVSALTPSLPLFNTSDKKSIDFFPIETAIAVHSEPDNTSLAITCYSYFLSDLYTNSSFIQVPTYKLRFDEVDADTGVYQRKAVPLSLTGRKMSFAWFTRKLVSIYANTIHATDEEPIAFGQLWYHAGPKNMQLRLPSGDSAVIADQNQLLYGYHTILADEENVGQVSGNWRTNRTLVVLEGERKVDYANKLFGINSEYFFASFANGSDSLKKVDPALHGFKYFSKIILWPDNDKAGAEGTEGFCTVCMAHNLNVHVVDIQTLVLSNGGSPSIGDDICDLEKYLRRQFILDERSTALHLLESATLFVPVEYSELQSACAWAATNSASLATLDKQACGDFEECADCSLTMPYRATGERLPIISLKDWSWAKTATGLTAIELIYPTNTGFHYLTTTDQLINCESTLDANFFARMKPKRYKQKKDGSWELVKHSSVRTYLKDLPDRLTIANHDYVPDKNTIFADDVFGLVYNSYRDNDIELDRIRSKFGIAKTETPEPPQDWLDFLYYIYGSESEQQIKFLIAALAYKVQNPTWHAPYMLFIYGPQGTGKDMSLLPFMEIIKVLRAYEKITPTDENLKSRFNSNLLGKQVIFYEEPDNSKRTQLINYIKGIIASKTLQIEFKGIDKSSYPSNMCALQVCSSNFAINLETTADRKTFVMHTCIPGVEDQVNWSCFARPGYDYQTTLNWFSKIGNKFDSTSNPNGYLRECLRVWDWLRVLDIGRFAAHFNKHLPMHTQAKDDLMAEVLRDSSKPEDILITLASDCEYPFNKDVIVSVELSRDWFVTRILKGRKISSRVLKEIMLRCGYREIPNNTNKGMHDINLRQYRLPEGFDSFGFSVHDNKMKQVGIYVKEELFLDKSRHFNTQELIQLWLDGLVRS